MCSCHCSLTEQLQGLNCEKIITTPALKCVLMLTFTGTVLLDSLGHHTFLHRSASRGFEFARRWQKGECMHCAGQWIQHCLQPEAVIRAFFACSH